MQQIRMFAPSRGRNGDFIAKRAQVWGTEGFRDVFVDVFSQRMGHQAPIQLHLTASEATNLGLALIQEGARE